MWFRVMQNKWWIECICNALWKLSQSSNIAQFYFSKCSVLTAATCHLHSQEVVQIHKIQANRIKSKWSFSQLLKWIKFCDPELQKLILSQQANTDGPHEVFCVTSNLICETFYIIFKHILWFWPLYYLIKQILLQRNKDLRSVWFRNISGFKQLSEFV